MSFIKDDQNLQVKFLRLEEEKYSALQEYRQQKLELLQRNMEANENVARYLQSFFFAILNLKNSLYTTTQFLWSYNGMIMLLSASEDR